MKKIFSSLQGKKLITAAILALIVCCGCSCGHRRQLPPGVPRTIEQITETSSEPESPTPEPAQPRVAGLKGYDSLRQCYDSLNSRYQASVLASDRQQTRISQLDTALRKKEKELEQLRKAGKDADGIHPQVVTASKAKLQEELKEVKAANQTLTELGSVLHIANFKIMPIHVSTSGRRQRITTRAKKTNDLRITFDIDPNYVAGRGEKLIYLVITNPKGKLQKVEDWTSGTTHNFNGESVPYTLEKKVVMRDGESAKNITINCKLDGLDQRGKFRFALYQNGYLIGEKALLLE
jgi:vacuolar-type H+-ATPase subunit I/STV1